MSMTHQPQRKPPLYLLTGLVVGLVLGLILAWIVWPARVAVVGPESLSEENKAQYRLMVSLSYAASGDLGRAQARLDLLDDIDSVRSLTTQAQIMLTNNGTQREARALAALAADLGASVASQQAAADAVNTPNVENNVSTPFETGGTSTYVLDSQELVCLSPEDHPSVQIYLSNAENLPQAGVALKLVSEKDDIEIGFATGQQPAQGPGYAETVISPSISYTLYIDDVKTMAGIQASACQTEEGESAWGSWLLLFHAEE